MSNLSPQIFGKEKRIQIFHRSDPFFIRFSVADRNCNQNLQFQHFHRFYEVFICPAIATEHIIGSKRITANPFDIVCLPPSELHSALYPNEIYHPRLVIQFSFDSPDWPLQNEIEKMLMPFKAKIPIYRFPDTVLWKVLMPLLEITKLETDNPNPLFLYTKVTDFLLLLNENMNNNLFLNEEIHGDVSKITQITDYILQNYQNDLSLASVAEHFHINNFYLSHLFKDATGYTLTDYIQITRISFALKALVFTKKKVGDIAEECGFASISQFNRSFIKHIGISPTEYRSKASESKTDESPLYKYNF